MIVSHDPLTGEYLARGQNVADFERLKGDGWNWSAKRGCYKTRREDLVAPMLPWMDRAAWDAWERRHRAREAAIASSAAADAEIDIPLPRGLRLLPYQRAGVAYALGRPGTLIADEMGLGKTVQAIAVANADPTISKVLIICPASLRQNWAGEWRRWCCRNIDARIITDRFDHITADRALIMSYQGARKWRRELLRIEFDLMICDEAHALKDSSTLQSRCVLGNGARRNSIQYMAPLAASRKLMLTGTPIVNRPEELFPLVRALDPRGLGRNRSEFERRFNAEQPARLAELNTELRARFMVRRLKSEVLTELPPKRRALVFVDVPNAAKALAEEAAVIRRTKSELSELREKAKGLPAGEAVKLMTHGRGLALTEISRARHATALLKAPAVIEHARAALAEVEKLIIFHHHRDVGDLIEAAFAGVAVRLDGSMNDKVKAEAVRAFQADAGARVFIGSLMAAGQGITLTAASHVIFGELAWTPAAMSQGEDRAHRIGQSESILVQHCVLDGSIDAKMSQLLVSKQEIIDACLGGDIPEAAKVSILDDLLA